LIVGGRNPETVDFWRRKSKEFQVEDYMIFTGFQENVYPLLAESDAYIFATTAEVCGSRGLLEAMISELPVVCRKTRSMAHWFKHLENIYFVDEATPEEFVKAILYLQKNESTRNKIGRKVRQKVLKEWDVEKFVDEFVDISRNLIMKRNLNRIEKQS
jgi:glycosyltransferase involved in cell wall biosynthesis